jgi:hypothetical protein
MRATKIGYSSSTINEETPPTLEFDYSILDAPTFVNDPIIYTLTASEDTPLSTFSCSEAHGIPADYVIYLTFNQAPNTFVAEYVTPTGETTFTVPAWFEEQEILDTATSDLMRVSEWNGWTQTVWANMPTENCYLGAGTYLNTPHTLLATGTLIFATTSLIDNTQIASSIGLYGGVWYIEDASPEPSLTGYVDPPDYMLFVLVWNGSTFKFYTNGGTPQTGSLSTPISLSIIGSDDTADNKYGLQRIAYTPDALTAAQLNALNLLTDVSYPAGPFTD